MRNVLLIGAGRSSSSLIKYLLDYSQQEQWLLTVGDVDLKNAEEKIAGHPNGRPILFEIHNELQRKQEISKSDVVISLLPAHMHIEVAEECVTQKKNLVTASYVSPQMQSLDEDAKKSGVLLLNECGLDPGIDHMSAMKIIDEIKSGGGEIISFKSYTGGLVAPESNDNPWGYKFSWNPRNVILAGQGTAKYILNGKYRYLPYQRLFTEIEKIAVKDYGGFDGYANRDSLSYRKIYGLENIPTMIRGTLRQDGFCKAWNVFVQLGITDDSYVIEDSEHLTYSDLVKAFLPENKSGKNIREHLADFLREDLNSEVMQKILWTGIVEDKKIGLPKVTPAGILQNLLEQKWKLKPEDKDMIVMQHLFEYTENHSSQKGSGQGVRRLTSSLVVKGENSVYTAMAKTVGLPAAIAAKLILNRKINLKGVHVPVQKEIYEPVLSELKNFGIVFRESNF